MRRNKGRWLSLWFKTKWRLHYRSTEPEKRKRVVTTMDGRSVGRVQP